MSEPRKVKVSVELVLGNDAPTAWTIHDTIIHALYQLEDVEVKVRVDELQCICGSPSWPIHCAYHDKSYGF